ncbi:MAG: transposase [Blastocatellia bacterium]
MFVADPRVPSDNNAAERGVREIVASRKISGGTRSEKGSEAKGILAWLFGTWRLQRLDLYQCCLSLLSAQNPTL